MEADGGASRELADALERAPSDPEGAARALQAVIARPDARRTQDKEKEQAIYELGKLYCRLGRANELRSMLVNLRPFFGTLPKSKTAKIVRSLIDMVGEIPNTAVLLAELCKESIEWCRAEKRAFLRQRIESRLAKLHLQMREYKEAISLVTRLAKEVKKVDDKLLLVEIHLTESRVHLALKNVPKSKGALTAARSAASAIYCPPLLQAEIDLQAGTLCAEERDFKTAFSYFFEAFEGYNTVNRPDDAVRCLKYMLLSKIMTDSPSEVYAIINSKSGVRHAGVEVESMRAIADAHKKRSLEAYEEVLAKFRPQLLDDPLVRAHLEELQDTLLEQNILRVVEPFSRVEIEHVARIMRLPQAQVEAKLSQLILDHKLRGILDQGAGLLILFGQSSADSTYETGLETIKELSNVVDKLYAKAKKLH